MRFSVLLLLIAFFVALPAQAQDAMSTDRPDFTEAPVTVGQGTLQIEAGATHQTVGDASLFTAGEGLVRYGLKPRFELRFGLPSLISGDGVDSGLSDLSLGFKWNMLSKDNGVEAGIIGSVTLPTGDEDFTSDDPNPSVIFVVGKPINERVSLAAQISGALIKAGGDWDADWMATAVLAAGITDAVGGFAEIMVTAPPVGDTGYVVHTGLTYGVSDDLQFDLHLGTGLNDAAGDEFIGFGVAFRR